MKTVEEWVKPSQSDVLRMTDKEKLMAHCALKTDTGCWIWMRSSHSTGYGQCWFHIKEDGDAESQAHRASWILHVGPIGDFFVLHNCPGGDNRRCVNPEHLFLGTHADNMADGKIKNAWPKGERHHSSLRPEVVPMGEKHWKCKLSDQQVSEIREKFQLIRTENPEAFTRKTSRTTLLCRICDAAVIARRLCGRCYQQEKNNGFTPNISDSSIYRDLSKTFGVSPYTIKSIVVGHNRAS